MVEAEVFPELFRHVVLRSVDRHTLDEVSARGLEKIGKRASRALVAKHARHATTALDRLFDSGRVRVIGIPSGPHGRFRERWKHIHPGDIVLFSAEKRVFSWATATYTCLARELAAALWKTDEQTYPHLIFLDAYRDIDVPMERFNQLAGFDPGFVINYFDVLGPKSKAILDGLGLPPARTRRAAAR